VPAVRGQRFLAEALAIDLEAHPQVIAVAVSPVTGSVLLCFSPDHPLSDAESWLRAALERQMQSSQATTDMDAARRVGTMPRSPLWRLLQRTEPYRGLRRRAMAASIADGLADGIPPLLVGLTTDTVSRGSSSLLGTLGFKTASSRLLALTGVSVVFWALAAVFEYAKERTTAELANVVRHDLRNQLYQHVQVLDIATVESREVSDWMAVLNDDVNQVHSFLRQGIEPMVAIASNIVVVGASFVLMSPGLALAQLLLVPPLVFASMALLKPIRAKFIAARWDGDRINALVTGNVSGMSTISSFNAQRIEAERVEEAGARFRASIGDADRSEAVYVPTLRAIAGTGFVTTLVWGGAQVSQGTLSVGGLDTMALAQLRLLAAVARMGVSLDSYQRTAAALDRIYQTLDLTPSIVGGTRALPSRTTSGELTFDNVVFGYDPARPVLRGLSLRCPAGRTTGIVGATGVGKSTLFKLLLRFYDIQSGRVCVDGVDVRDLRLDDLREAIAMVSQQITLFAGTIHDNIAYARPDASFDEVVHAARTAEAHEFIEALPDGYEARIGFGGLTLSGGQRQRLAIARAVLANRPILLFDEATSALDHATEAALQRSLEVATRNRTTIIVAHRLSTIRHSDIIYVLEDGCVSEAGQHDELIAAGGLYASMWGVQTGDVRRGSGPNSGARRKRRSDSAPI
jgi:ATP-binding cassette subfamily B protein